MIGFWEIVDGFLPLITFAAGVAIGHVFGREIGHDKGFRDGVRAARSEFEEGWRRA